MFLRFLVSVWSSFSGKYSNAPSGGLKGISNIYWDYELTLFGLMSTDKSSCKGEENSSIKFKFYFCMFLYTYDKFF